MSQQRKSCHDITFRIHNKEQQNSVVTKIISVATNKYEGGEFSIATKS